jgi:hypothetical protein
MTRETNKGIKNIFSLTSENYLFGRVEETSSRWNETSREGVSDCVYVCA